MLTVFTTCDKCDKQVTVNVNPDDSLDNKYYCTHCSCSGTTNSTAIVRIDGFKRDNIVEVKQEPVKSSEEKALDELKEFCVGV